MKRVPPSLLLVVCGVLLVASAVAAESSIDFDRDVRPILSAKCFACHGPDGENREAELRFDTPAGYQRVVSPGNTADSELIRRVRAVDPDQRMPPVDSGPPLSADQLQVLHDWIAAGAPWNVHWAFRRPVRSRLPTVASQDWPRTPIDFFVLARLEEEGLSPSEEADRRSWVRRATLDLTGLPPTSVELDLVLNDSGDDAESRLVDRLLASPAFGERMALEWLDAARYSDSFGYHEDWHRDMWGWRDWVIASLNENLPFDQFAIAQVAGDLLPDASPQQRIASGFNRLHGVTSSGLEDEYRMEYLVDRVQTASTVWLGLTVACAQCHDHKYDPITQEDYYRFFAFFDGTDDPAIMPNHAGNVGATERLWTDEGERERQNLRRQLDELRHVVQDAQSREAELHALEAELQTLAASMPTTMVMRAMPDRAPTRIRIRGRYDQYGEPVNPDTPAVLPTLPAGVERNRLALAQWLVRDDHPLTARVAVNRIWQSLFGVGLVATAEDFGTQGEIPSHPELLDWLAVEFMESGWNTKALVRMIVNSATYRQTSAGSEQMVRVDPNNRLLGRGPRFRLPAETIRDAALAASGLLVHRVGGPSVKPYQPARLWIESSTRGYQQDQGSKLYRRSIYTYVRRSVPPVNMTALDAPNRETCTVRRQRTNTPLMALVTMNDPTFVEAARELPERAMQSVTRDSARLVATSNREVEQIVDQAFQFALGRAPNRTEVEVLTELFRRQLKTFDRDQAVALLDVGAAPRSTDLDDREHAAWTTVASVILNLDEFLSKE